MPSQRLLAMGLLSKYPEKSSVLKRFLNAQPGIKYTDYEKMHMTALYHTPGISKEWMRHQIESRGGRFSLMTRIACKPKNKARWAHLGPRNILFIGQPEVERYFARAKRYVAVPSWALPVFNDHVKQGMSQQAIADKYGISRRVVNECINKRSMFDPESHNSLRGKTNQPFIKG